MEFVFIVLLCAFILYLGLIRNTQVFRFRTGLIDTISNRSQAALQDLKHTPNLTLAQVNEVGDYMSQRYAAYDAVSYHEMVLKFWKPLKPEAWYKDTAFLR